jgi:exonuclease VII small subunit
VGKKKTKTKKVALSAPQPETMTTVHFGYEEMLSELEAIVAAAEIRLQEEESIA